MAVKTDNLTDIEDILVIQSRYSERTEMLTITLNRQVFTGYEYDVFIGFQGNVSTGSTFDGGLRAVKNHNDGSM